MDAIVSFLGSIGNGILSIVDFISTLISDLAYMVQLLSDFIEQLPFYLSWIPPGVGAVISLTFSIVVVMKLTGHG